MNVINTGILSMAMDLSPSRNSPEGEESAKKGRTINRKDFQNFEKYLRSEVLKYARISEKDKEQEVEHAGMKIASFLGIKLC